MEVGPEWVGMGTRAGTKWESSMRSLWNVHGSVEWDKNGLEWRQKWGQE